MTRVVYLLIVFLFGGSDSVKLSDLGVEDGVAVHETFRLGESHLNSSLVGSGGSSDNWKLTG